MFRMKVSGYDEKQRFEVLKSGFATYDNIKKLESEGKRPFFRPPDFEEEERRKAKKNNKTQWFKKIKTSSL